jgi:tRNA threonylcarbamoyladenosine biosynthesis protein TsaE
MKKVFFTKEEKETKKLGGDLAKKFLKTKKGPLIFALMGPLGSGKTTFLKGFSRVLGIKEEILSPTFVIMKRFKLRKKTKPLDYRFRNFYHLDCFRIKKEKEIVGLGFKKIISDPKNILVIEWAEKIKNLLPKKTIFLKFKMVGLKKRKISLIVPKDLEIV